MSTERMNTLEDALATGQGIERPFRCTEHDDHQASASVNILKNVWHCFACQASGAVDSRKAPKVDELLAMLEPDTTPRVYPSAYLELFENPIYWRTRFAPWVCHAMGLGQDPFTGAATFPVHTPSGHLAGLGRRQCGDAQPRYLYPPRWSAANSLFGTAGHYPALPVLVLVEGAGDATACWEVGAPALAVYGSGVHLPQRDLIVRYNPQLILAGFDMDPAGELAATSAFKQLGRIAPIKRVYWPKGDPADCSPGQRRSALVSAVSRHNPDTGPTTWEWNRNIQAMKKAYANHTKEMAS